MTSVATPIELLLALLDEAYDRQSWHGTNLRGSLRGITAAQADWRPAPRRHSVRDIALHAAYWKYAVRRRLTRDPRGSFAVKGSNWFPPDPARTWAHELALLGLEHKSLRAAVAALAPADLDRPLLRNGRSAGYLVRGIAAHDLYHAGQIQLLKRLQKRSR
jgi:hypothetical protein